MTSRRLDELRVPRTGQRASAQFVLSAPRGISHRSVGAARLNSSRLSVRFAGQWRAIGPLCCQLAAEHRYHRVVAQLVVIDQVLVAQGKPKHPLTDQAPYGVLDQISITVIGEAVGRRAV